MFSGIIRRIKARKIHKKADHRVINIIDQCPDDNFVSIQKVSQIQLCWLFFFCPKRESTLRLEAKREKKYGGYFHNAKLTELVFQDGKHGESNQTGREKKRWDLSINWHIHQPSVVSGNVESDAAFLTLNIWQDTEKLISNK